MARKNRSINDFNQVATIDAEKEVDIENETKVEYSKEDIFEKPKSRIEDTHERKTFLIEKQLLNRFDRLSRNKTKGYKTRVINVALKQILDEIEENQ